MNEQNNDSFDDELVTVEEEVQTEEPEKKPKNAAAEIFDWVEVMALSLAVILLVFTYIGRLAIVDGSSMNKTLYDGEALLISKAFYEPKQGDIIVFQIPGGHGVLGQPLVKRIIATGGQTIYIDYENWKTYVYEDADMPIEQVLKTVKPFEEIYQVDINYKEGYMNRGMGLKYPYTLPEGKLFVMGDNRNDSTDSRFAPVGPVDERYILGKVYCRLTPFDKMGVLN